MAVVDPTASSQPCLAKVEILARACNASIELFACDNQGPTLSGPRANGSSARLDALLDSLAVPLRAAGIGVNCSSICAAPLHSAILRQAGLCNAGLIVKDTHHHPLVRRTFLTNTDWHLIRECEVPLLLTKAAPWKRRPVLVAAVDPGHTNDKSETLDQAILNGAQAICVPLSGDLHIAHAFIPPSLRAAALTGTPPAWVPEPNEKLETEAAARLAKLKSMTVDLALDAENLHFEFGIPADALLRVVDVVAADILVIGAVSRNALDRVFIGATAERILEPLGCDVLVLKPPNFATDLPF